MCDFIYIKKLISILGKTIQFDFDVSFDDAGALVLCATRKRREEKRREEKRRFFCRVTEKKKTQLYRIYCRLIEVDLKAK